MAPSDRRQRPVTTRATGLASYARASQSELWRTDFLENVVLLFSLKTGKQRIAGSVQQTVWYSQEPRRTVVEYKPKVGGETRYSRM
jgi:hypothetical protein